MTRCPRCKSMNSLIQEDGDDYCVLCGYRKDIDPLGTPYTQGRNPYQPSQHIPNSMRIDLAERDYRG